MNVALYVPWIYLKGGAERVVLELTGRSRHNWTIFTNYYSPETTFPEFKKRNVVELPRVSVERSFSRLLAAGFKIMNQKLPLENFDALVVSAAGFGEFIAIKNHNLPTICSCNTPLKVIHDAITREAYLAAHPLQRTPFLLFEKTYRFFEKRAWKHFDFVVCISNETKKRVLQGKIAPADRIEVLHPGVDLAKMKPGKKFDEYFLLPGRIMWHKNIELGVAAFKEFRKKRKDFKLVVAGAVDEKSKPYLEKLRKLTEGKGIYFIVNPSEEKLFSLYRNCYAVLFTALNEDWGIVPLEGMAFGRPVISVNQGGPKESIVNGKTGFLVEPIHAAVAEKMLELAENPSLVRMMGKTGRKHAAIYDWNRFVERFDEVIEEVVRSRVK